MKKSKNYRTNHFMIFFRKLRGQNVEFILPYRQSVNAPKIMRTDKFEIRIINSSAFRSVVSTLKQFKKIILLV